MILHHTTIRFLFALAFLMAGNTDPALSQELKNEGTVEVTSVKSNNAFHVNAENRNPFSITLTIKVTGENFKLNTRQPITKVVKGNSTKHLVSVYAKEKGKSFEFSTNYNWVMGNTLARHNDTYIYSLPYQTGRSYRIGQGYNGSFSHSGSIRYSIDFMMPLKTQVHAARGGRVVQIYEDSDRGGASDEFKDASNFITIEHNDGTFAEYAHLSRNGVLVNLGQKVFEGQVIGLSGNTGYSSGPHLHFMVIKINEDGTSISLPVRFKTKSGVVDTLNESFYYTAN
jgi:murein DD-endopeptidase MepM/ murein hydrolase activator NlpD